MDPSFVYILLRKDEVFIEIARREFGNQIWKRKLYERGTIVAKGYVCTSYSDEDCKWVAGALARARGRNRVNVLIFILIVLLPLTLMFVSGVFIPLWPLAWLAWWGITKFGAAC